MNKETLLKKEFKQSDIQRVRNIVNKDVTSTTKQQVGYKKVTKQHKEGDVWEEAGKKWTIKNGIKQNITKLHNIKKAVRLPLRCPNCGGPMQHHLAKKMYKIHGFCFDPCTVEYEASLRKAGLYQQYENRMMQGNMQQFIKDIEQWAQSHIEMSSNFVTEDGDIESWKGNSKHKQEILNNIKQYTNKLAEHIN